MLSKATQEKWARLFYLTPANRTVKLDGPMTQLIPIRTGPQIRSIIKWDWDWVNQGAREQMIEKWNREIIGR